MSAALQAACHAEAVDRARQHHALCSECETAAHCSAKGCIPKVAPLELSSQQRKVVDYMRVFLRVNQQLPTSAKIAQDFGWSSPNAAFELLAMLEKKGVLERNELGNYMLSAAALTGSGS